MNKKKLQEMLRKKEERKAKLIERSNAANDLAELRSINAELETMNQEIAELRGIIDAMPDDPIAGGETLPAEQRGAQPPVDNSGITQVLASYGFRQQEQRAEEPADRFSTMEYRRAFMDFAKTGNFGAELRKVMDEYRKSPEFRANQITTTTDVSAVIPTTIMNEVIRKMTVYGQVFQRLRKMNIQGGVDFPILSLKPVATWIGETTPSDKQKVEANTKVSFSYYGLECKVSISLLANTVTLSGFESTIIDLIVEAMIKAAEIAVVSGNGTGKMLGITVDTRVPAGQKVTLSSSEFGAWDAWKKKVFAKLPLAYKAGAVFLMASGTYEGYIDGMVDANGQPIGRTNYGIADGPQGRFGGRTVVEVEDDVIANYDDAAEGTVVAILVNLQNYGVNSNMEMTMFRYFDHDTNEWVDKAILIADGKLIDPNGVVIVKKGA